MRRFVTRFINLFRRDRAEDELSREVTSHLGVLEDEYTRRGMTPDQARLAARRAIGSIALAKDLHRDARSFVWVEDLRRDFRHATRALRRAPGFTIVAVTALALGIGVSTTFFTIVDAICLRGLPIDDPERVMFVSTRDAQNRPGSLSYAEFDDLRARTSTFERVGAYQFTIVSLRDDQQPPARVSGAFVSAGAFELIGERPMLGRTFRVDEDRPGSAAVVMLGEELWSSRYDRDPSVVGRSVVINGIPSTVIGVMPRGMQFPANADLWRPMASIPAQVRDSKTERRLGVFARLTPRTTVEQARADADAIGAAWQRESPATNRGLRLRVVPINQQLNPSVMQQAWLAFITAGALVLLVACANMTNLLLMRAASRGREMAIRTSIGATRGRVVRQLLVECSTLSMLAGALGTLFAWAGLRLLQGMIPPETMPYWMAFTIDGRVLAVTTAVCLATVFACGMPPALHAARVDVRDALSETSSASTTRAPRRWIATLLAAEFAITLVLVAMTVDGVRSNIENRRKEFQIDPTSLLTMWLTLPGDSYGTPALRAGFFERLNERIGRSTSIGSVALTSALPYGGGSQLPIVVSGRLVEDDKAAATVVSASERYFEVLGVPLVRGRAFTATDGQPGSEAAIVNQRFVRLFMPDQEPIGARIRVGGEETPWRQIVGVTTTFRQQVGGPEPDPVVFLPFQPAPSQTTAIVVRTPRDPTTPVSTLRREIAQLDPNLPLYRVMTFEQVQRNGQWLTRMSDALVKSISIVALVLALIGIYAVTAHTVQRWTRELGLRLALGAVPAEIGWLVLRRVLSQLAIGLGLGLVLVLAFDRLFNPAAVAGTVRMTDPLALALIVCAISAIAAVACLVPIRRAASIDLV